MKELPKTFYGKTELKRSYLSAKNSNPCTVIITMSFSMKLLKLPHMHRFQNFVQHSKASFSFHFLQASWSSLVIPEPLAAHCWQVSHSEVMSNHHHFLFSSLLEWITFYSSPKHQSDENQTFLKHLTHKSTLSRLISRRIAHRVSDSCTSIFTGDCPQQSKGGSSSNIHSIGG